MSFKPRHVSIPKRRIFLPLVLFCAYDSSVLQNFKIFTHLLPNFSHMDPRLTEVTYHCTNFNDRVRKVPKNYDLNVWNVSDLIVEVNAVVRHFRQRTKNVFVFVIFFHELSLIIRFVFVFVIFFLELSIYNDVSSFRPLIFVFIQYLNHYFVDRVLITNNYKLNILPYHKNQA